MSVGRFANEEVIRQLPLSLQKLATWERFHLHNVEFFQNLTRDPAFDTRYLPQNCTAFQLPCFWVLRKHLYVYGRQAQDVDELRLFEGEGIDERVLFPIHPLSFNHYREFLTRVKAQDAATEGACIWAVPTASTRTLLAWPDERPEKALFIKTSLQSPLFGDRRLLPGKVAGSVGFSRLVQDSLPSLPSAFSYFPESVGFVPRRLQDGGVIVRSIPREIKEGRLLVAPLFSLFGGKGDHVPLLLTMIERHGVHLLKFVEDVFCALFARAWLQMGMRFGLMLEAHAQDLMLTLSPDLVPLGRFYYRDFEGLQVDWELRRWRGLPEPENLPRAWLWRETYATRGTPCTDFVWYKWIISLLCYFYFVLNEFDLSLREWQSRGLVHGRKFETDEVTMIFSQHMMKEVEEMFGVRVEAPYNIHRSLHKFALFLFNIRKELISRR